MLKKSFIILSFIAAMAVSFCSCTFETSDNGSLDGAWHLLRINDQTQEEHPDLYWSFQNKLLELTDKSTGYGVFLMRFSHKDGQLVLSDPYIYDRENGDKPLEDPAFLKPFGIYNLEESFEVVSLSRSRMTLKSANVKLEFRKF